MNSSVLDEAAMHVEQMQGKQLFGIVVIDEVILRQIFQFIAVVSILSVDDADNNLYKFNNFFFWSSYISAMLSLQANTIENREEAYIKFIAQKLYYCIEKSYFINALENVSTIIS